MKGKFQDLTGHRFSKLTVIERREDDKHRNTTWLCRCDCGNTTVVRANALNQGRAKSCGCLSKNKPKNTIAPPDRPCTGVDCNESKCWKDCGWHPDEQEKRKRMIYDGAMQKDENGRLGLVIKRRKANVHAD